MPTLWAPTKYPDRVFRPSRLGTLGNVSHRPEGASAKPGGFKGRDQPLRRSQLGVELHVGHLGGRIHVYPDHARKPGQRPLGHEATATAASEPRDRDCHPHRRCRPGPYGSHDPSLHAVSEARLRAACRSMKAKSVRPPRCGSSATKRSRPPSAVSPGFHDLVDVRASSPSEWPRGQIAEKNTRVGQHGSLPDFKRPTSSGDHARVQLRVTWRWQHAVGRRRGRGALVVQGPGVRNFAAASAAGVSTSPIVTAAPASASRFEMASPTFGSTRDDRPAVLQ